MAAVAPTDDDLFDIVAKEALIDRATLHRDLALADAGIASIEVISILFAIEDRYEVRVDEKDLAGCETLGELTDRLRSRLQAPK